MGLKRYRSVFFVVFLVLLGLEIFALVKSPFIFVGLEDRVWPFLLAAFILLIASFVPWRIFRNIQKVVNLAFLIFLGFSFVNIFWLDFKVIAFLIATCILGGIKLLLEHLNKKKDLFLKEDVYKYLFLAMLVLISLGSFFDFFSSKMTGLSIVTILLGVLTFYYNRDVIDEIEEEKEDEEKAEQKRAKEFDRKFPKLAWFNFDYGITKNWKEKRYFVSILRALAAPFIWFARLPYSFVKWMYKEGWWYSGIFITLTLIFIAIKILIPIVYTGSYIDEYNHILSGLEFFKTGHFAEIYHGSYYTRGAYVSFLVGLLMFLFGETIFVAKMLPAAIGIVNFFLLYKIAKQIFHDKKYILLFLAIYTAIPWFIFNHFYIRMYVFYEFFMIFLTFLFILIISNIKNVKKLLIYTIMTFITLLIIYFFSNDDGMYMVLLYSLFFISYIFFFEIQKIPIKNRGVSWLTNNHLIKIIIFIGIGILLFLYLDGFSLIERFISGSVQFSSGAKFKYDNLFFNQNLIFSIFFILSACFLFFKKTSNITKIIILSSLALFTIHYNSSLDFQMTRIIIYFLPLFYLISVFVFSTFSKIYKHKFFPFFVLLFLFLSVLENYPDDFFSEGPYVPTEVNYKDYLKSNEYIQRKIGNNSDITIISSLPHINKFYNTQGDFIVLRDNKNANYDKSSEFFEKECNCIKDSILKVNVLSGCEELKDILKKDNKTVIYIDKDLKSWINIDTYRYIIDNSLWKHSFKRIEVYYFE